MFDAQLASHNDSSKGEGTAHVDGAVVEGHGSGLALGEQLRYEAEAHGILCGLSSRKPNPGRQQLPKAVHLHSMLLEIIVQHRDGLMSRCMFAANLCVVCREWLLAAGSYCYYI